MPSSHLVLISVGVMYIQELGPEDVSLLERCPHIREYLFYVYTGFNDPRCVPIREVSSFQRYRLQWS